MIFSCLDTGENLQSSFYIVDIVAFSALISAGVDVANNTKRIAQIIRIHNLRQNEVLNTTFAISDSIKPAVAARALALANINLAEFFAKTLTPSVPIANKDQASKIIKIVNFLNKINNKSLSKNLSTNDITEIKHLLKSGSDVDLPAGYEMMPDKLDFSAWAIKMVMSSSDEAIDMCLSAIKKIVKQSFASTIVGVNLNNYRDINLLTLLVLDFFDINFFEQCNKGLSDVGSASRSKILYSAKMFETILLLQHEPSLLMLCAYVNNTRAIYKLLNEADKIYTLGVADNKGRTIEYYCGRQYNLLSIIQQMYIKKHMPHLPADLFVNGVTNPFDKGFKKLGLVICSGVFGNYRHKAEYFDTLDLDPAVCPTFVMRVEDIDLDFIAAHSKQYKVIVLENITIIPMQQKFEGLFKNLSSILADDGMILFGSSPRTRFFVDYMSVYKDLALKSDLKYGAMFNQKEGWIGGSNLKPFILTKSPDGFDLKKNKPWIANALFRVLFTRLFDNTDDMQIAILNQEILNVAYNNLPDKFEVAELSKGWQQLQNLSLGEYRQEVVPTFFAESNFIGFSFPTIKIKQNYQIYKGNDLMYNKQHEPLKYVPGSYSPHDFVEPDKIKPNKP